MQTLGSMGPTIRPAVVADAPAISALVQDSFNQFVAPDWQAEAREVFMTESSAERFTSSIPEAAYAAVAHVGDQLVGMVLMPTPSVLAFLFVRPGMLRAGIGSLLWEAARTHIEANHPSVKTIELNSSPYAVAAYRAYGFYPISEPFRRGGCLATRMACWLPGRALAAGSGATILLTATNDDAA